MDLSETYKRVRPACVAIALGKELGDKIDFISFGSGACVDRSGIVVTAKHVVTGYYEHIKGEKITTEKALSDPDFFVIFSWMEAKAYKVIYVNPQKIMFSAESDVAIMKIPEIQGGLPCIAIPDSWQTLEGDEVATSGYPLRGWHNKSIIPNLFSGIVSQIQCQYIEDKGWKVDQLILDMSIHPGNSGGPVFDKQTGSLIGIVSSQSLRPLNLSESINVVLAGASEFSARTWTNIVQCVPWTSFANGIDELIKSGK